jgi:hypothetical protein
VTILTLSGDHVLPDFVRVKKRSERQLLRWLEQQIPELTPLIKGVQRFRQHEGRLGKIVRSDASEGTLDYPLAEFPLEISRDDIRSGDIDRIKARVLDLARRIGEHQTKEMLKVAGEAADAAGNVVNAGGGELTQEHFLEVFRRIHMDFDPVTLQPLPGGVFVMHPDMAQKIVPKVKAWEQEPAFNAKYKTLIQKKREEWRDREANRKLVS